MYVLYLAFGFFAIGGAAAAFTVDADVYDSVDGARDMGIYAPAVFLGTVLMLATARLDPKSSTQMMVDRYASVVGSIVCAYLWMAHAVETRPSDFDLFGDFLIVTILFILVAVGLLLLMTPFVSNLWDAD